MIDTLINKLASDLKSLTADKFPAIPEAQLKALLEARLRDLNLVTREEFDAQAAVLKRTRMALEALEKQVRALETNSGSKAE